MGRLFDAVAALVLAKKTAAFEAELAMELEQVAAGCRLPALQAGRQVFPTDRQATGYQFKITKSREGYILDPRPIFRGILLDLKRGRAKEKIAYRFHLTIAEMMWATCFLLRKENNLNKVVLSGGVFQNKLLFRLSTSLLAKEGFNVYWHRQLAASDSSLSLGQAAIACFR
jgi:hydrogenase maturation protein HypF